MKTTQSITSHMGGRPSPSSVFCVAIPIFLFFAFSAYAAVGPDAGLKVKMKALETTDLGKASDSLIPAAVPLNRLPCDTLNFGYFTMISGQYYAVLGETWTFDHGSANPLEGWSSTDLTANDGPWFRRITASTWNGNNNPVAAPLISGNASAWAGLYESEARVRCYLGGLGYGNNWCQRYTSPTLTYDGSGAVDLAFKYFNNTEPNFDFTRVILRIGSTETVLNGTGFTGTIGNPATSTYPTFTTSIPQSAFPGSTTFNIIFEVSSDVGWSDEDNGYPTSYGPFGVDDITVTNNLVGGNQSWTFESGTNGFVASTCPGVGSYMGVADVSNYILQDPNPCGISGNLLEFHDANQLHPVGQHEVGISPTIDKSGLPSNFYVSAVYDTYCELPTANGVFYRPCWTYYPYVCPTTGVTGWSPRVGPANYVSTSQPTCFNKVRDSGTTHGVPFNSQLVRFEFEIYASCDQFGIPPTTCTGVTNATPLFDNIRVSLTPCDSSGIGACCLANGTCISTTQSNCFHQAGCVPPGAGFQGMGTSCQPNPCPQPTPTGACCFTDGSCSTLTSAHCVAQSGSYHGNGVSCNPNPCPAPTQPPDCYGLVWNQMEPAGPTPRYAVGMVYDWKNAVTVLYGGYDGSNSGETWLYDGSTWTLASTTGPGPRLYHSMTYDVKRGKVVLFGGYDTNFKGDTWEWDGVTWTQVSNSGPSPREGAALAYDYVRERVVLFGGLAGNVCMGDTWEWDGSTWQQKTPTATPGTRFGAAATWDGNSQNIVLHGGFRLPTPGMLGDTWTYDGTTWTHQTAGPDPSPRYFHGMAYDYSANRVVLFGTDNSTWLWNGVVWEQLSSTVPGNRQAFGMTYDLLRGRGVVFGGVIVNAVPLCETWEWHFNCHREHLPEDAQGNPKLPPWVDTPPPHVEYTSPKDLVQNIYGGCVDSLYMDTWYRDMLCDPSVGGTVPPAMDLLDSLRIYLNDPTVTPQAVAQADSLWETLISLQGILEPDSLAQGGPVTAPYTPPPVPYQPNPEGCYMFGGRDIVFVHGLRIDPMFEAVFGATNTDWNVKWHRPTVWPGSIQNPAYYGSGYWKSGAERYWEDHIARFLASRGVKNRYLIVCYDVNQRVSKAAEAVLTQIADAMNFGTGVVDPSGFNNTQGFGTKNYVAISHDLGSLVTDVAMAAGANNPNLGAAFVPQYCKAHIAYNGTFCGTRLATAVVIAAAYLTVSPPNLPPWLEMLTCKGMDLLNHYTGSSNVVLCNVTSPDFWRLAGSCMVDLVPMLTQLKWGQNYVDKTPVHTIMIVDGHPTFNSPLKYILNSGFDDGMVAINSQTASPNNVLLWPSGFVPNGWLIGLAKTFDMGVFVMHPPRAVGYYVDQVFDRVFNPLNLLALPEPLVAGGADPYLSPTGMKQSVGHQYARTWDQSQWGFNPLDRYKNHFSYIEGSADHFVGSTGMRVILGYWDGYWGENYWPTWGLWSNREETRVITDHHIFDNVASPYGDNEPILTPANVPPMEQFSRDWHIGPIKFLGHTIIPKIYLWYREYNLMQGWEDKHQVNFAYQSILKNSLYNNCPPVTGAPESDQSLPDRVTFGEMYPNPSNGPTTLHYELPVGGKIKMYVYDVVGRQVRTLADGDVVAGYHTVEWDRMTDRHEPAPAGVYFVRGRFTGERGLEGRVESRMVVIR